MILFSQAGCLETQVRISAPSGIDRAIGGMVVGGDADLQPFVP
jgi:hypothetical protein